MQSERWNWLDEGIVPLLSATLRAAWLWPWLALLHAWFSPSQIAPVLPFWALVALPFIVFTLTRRLVPRPTQGNVQNVSMTQRVIIAASGLLLLLLLLWWHFARDLYALWSPGWLYEIGYQLTHWWNELPVVGIALIAGVYLWLRGLFDARDPLHHEDIWRAFVVGAAALALHLWLNSATGSSVTGITGPIFLFFASGMAALATTNLKTASGWSLFGKNTGRIWANRYWLLSIGLTILALLALGLIIGWLLAPDDVAWLLRGVGFLFSLIWQVFSWVILGVSYVIFMAFYAIYRLIEPLLQNNGEESQVQIQAPQPFPTQEAMQEVTDAAAGVPEPFRWVALVLVLVVIFVIFVLVLRRLRSESPGEADETRESIYSADLLQDQLAALWSRLRGGFSRATAPLFYDLSGETDSRSAIRAVYQRLLLRAAEAGSVRAAAQTPLEYQRDLQRHLSAAAQLDTITRGYVEARYADTPPSPQMAAAVEEAWRQMAEMKREE